MSCCSQIGSLYFIFFYEGRYARGHLQIQIFYGRTIYFRGGGWKNKKSLIWKAFVQGTLQKLCRKKKVKKVANSGELCISFPVAARPCTVVGRCGMIPVLKSQQPSESLGFATAIRTVNPVQSRSGFWTRKNAGTIPVPYWTGTM